jgi:hypothetical protein
MADNGSGGIGVLGVPVGALIVVVIGFGLLYATGHMGGGPNQASIKIEVPKAPGTTGTGAK